jgi:hypothetical protein
VDIAISAEIAPDTLKAKLHNGKLLAFETGTPLTANVYHLCIVEDPCELFPITTFEV